MLSSVVGGGGGSCRDILTVCAILFGGHSKLEFLFCVAGGFL